MRKFISSVATVVILAVGGWELYDGFYVDRTVETYNEAVAFQKQENYTEAEKLYKEVLGNYDFPEVHLSLSVIYELQGQWEKALKEAEVAIGQAKVLTPDDERKIFVEGETLTQLKARTYSQKGDVMYKQVLDEDFDFENASAKDSLAFIIRKIDELEATIKIYQQAKVITPQNKAIKDVIAEIEGKVAELNGFLEEVNNA